MSEFLSLSAVDQARLLRALELSSEQLVAAYLERIERLNPRLTAFVNVFAEDAFKDARRKDRALGGRSSEAPPFLGVPLGINDLNMVRGKRALYGSRAGLINWSPIDDHTVARLRASGFVFLGKLATPEYGAMPITEPDIQPPTLNP